MPERISDGCLTFAVLEVMERVDQFGPARDRALEHRRNVDDLEHHLMRSYWLWCPSSGSDLGHHQFGRRPVGEAELRAVALADADVLDESEDVRVPRHGLPHVGHGQYGRYARVRG